MDPESTEEPPERSSSDEQVRPTLLHFAKLHKALFEENSSSIREHITAGNVRYDTPEGQLKGSHVDDYL